MVYSSTWRERERGGWGREIGGMLFVARGGPIWDMTQVYYSTPRRPLHYLSLSFHLLHLLLSFLSQSSLRYIYPFTYMCCCCDAFPSIITHNYFPTLIIRNLFRWHVGKEVLTRMSSLPMLLLRWASTYLLRITMLVPRETDCKLQTPTIF